MDNDGELPPQAAAVDALAWPLTSMSHVTVAMLAEAPVQIEQIGPPVSGDVWEAYLAVERTAARPEAPDH